MKPILVAFAVVIAVCLVGCKQVMQDPAGKAAQSTANQADEKYKQRMGQGADKASDDDSSTGSTSGS